MKFISREGVCFVVVFETRQASVTPTADYSVKFISVLRDIKSRLPLGILIFLISFLLC
ncbi:hypothetical protein [Pseudoalteromonas sp. S2721]|uniref:hypothetical protein n=1 Tax=Pseudoalteromonas sp. S2721 TaxID=579526 RepID=UPI0014873E2C|nr:hypothetical protein [Pseudoalteromonas sp. S2721]